MTSRNRLRPLAATVVLTLLGTAPLVFGAARAAPDGSAQAVQSAVDCLAVADSQQRLACYDVAVKKLQTALGQGDVVVIDRQQATEAHRQAFGLNLPSLNFVTKALKPEEVDTLDGVIESAGPDGSGRWVIRLVGGAEWRQISGQVFKSPKAGAKVRIRKASLGSFLMNIDGQPAIKVHRDE